MEYLGTQSRLEAYSAAERGKTFLVAFHSFGLMHRLSRSYDSRYAKNTAGASTLKISSLGIRDVPSRRTGKMKYSPADDKSTTCEGATICNASRWSLRMSFMLGKFLTSSTKKMSHLSHAIEASDTMSPQASLGRDPPEKPMLNLPLAFTAAAECSAEIRCRVIDKGDTRAGE